MESSLNLKSYLLFRPIIASENFSLLFTKKIKNDSLVTTIFQIFGSLNKKVTSKAEFSEKQFLRKTALLPS